MNKTHPHPFPFIKGQYWLDNSSFSKFLECPQMYENEVLHKRVAAFNRTALNYGKGIHTALAALALSHGSCYTKANLPKINEVLENYFNKHPQPPDDHRQYGLAKETIRRYVTLYEIEPWKILESGGSPLVERVIWHPLHSYNGIQINYWGLLDLAVTASDKSIWLVDHKTTSMLGKMFSYDMKFSGQMRGYGWLFQKCLGTLPQGYIIDAIRSLAPPDSAMKSANALETWWAGQFMRLPYFLDQSMIDEWVEVTKNQLNTLLFHYENNTFPLNYHACAGNKFGVCQYAESCVSLPKSHRLVALNSNMFIDNKWAEDNLTGKV